MQRGSTGFMSAVDTSIAFDRVKHSKLFEQIVARSMPNCILLVLTGLVVLERCF